MSREFLGFVLPIQRGKLHPLLFKSCNCLGIADLIMEGPDVPIGLEVADPCRSVRISPEQFFDEAWLDAVSFSGVDTIFVDLAGIASGIDPGISHRIGSGIDSGISSDISSCIGIDSRTEALLNRLAGLTGQHTAQHLRKGPKGPQIIPIVGGHGLLEALAARGLAGLPVALKGSEASGFCGTDTVSLLFDAAVCRHGWSPSDIAIWGGVATAEAAAAFFMLGVRGVVHESLHWLTSAVSLSPAARSRISSLSHEHTTVVGEALGLPVRLYDKGNSGAVRGLAAKEDRLLDLDPDEARRSFLTEVTSVWSHPFKSDHGPRGPWEVVPLSPEAAFARRFVERYGEDLGEAASKYADEITRLCQKAPVALDEMRAGRAVASLGTALPILQGGMSCITDKIDLASAVADAGALPTLAVGLKSREELEREFGDLSRALGGRPYAVNVIALDENPRLQEQIAWIEASRPPFVVVAAGAPAYVSKFRALGLKVIYIAQSKDLIRLAVKEGASVIVLEGNEAGGHVGALTSLTLAQVALTLRQSEPDLFKEAHLVLAGGTHDRVSALRAAMLGAEAIQMGTAYLASKEIVETGALSAAYQESVLGARPGDTRVTGRRLGLRVRSLMSPKLQAIETLEREMAIHGIDEQEARHRMEALCVGSLLVAAREVEAPGGGRLATEVCLREGQYMCGAVAGNIDHRYSLRELHAELFAPVSPLYVPDFRDFRDFRDLRDPRDPRDLKDLRGTRDVRDSGGVADIMGTKGPVVITRGLSENAVCPSFRRKPESRDDDEAWIPAFAGMTQGREKPILAHPPVSSAHTPVSSAHPPVSSAHTPISISHPPISKGGRERIAITGMAMNNALGKSVAEVWANTRALGCGIAQVPPSRWDHGAYFDAEPGKPGKTYCRVAAFQNLTVTRKEIGIPPQDFNTMCQSTRMTLWLAKKAIESSSILESSIPRERIGVIVSQNSGELGSTVADLVISAGASNIVRAIDNAGHMSDSALAAAVARLRQGRVMVDDTTLLGRINSAAGGFICNLYGLRGPSFSVGAACASGLVALWCAYGMVRAGILDAAVVGGSEELLFPATFMEFSALRALAGALSSDLPQACRPFDAHRDGMVLGEGGAVLIIERESLARKRGASIHAFLEGMGAGNNDRGMVESVAEIQRVAIANAYADAGWQPDSVGLVECHATATPQGDVEEVRALKSVIPRRTGVALSSYKSQIGHTLGASGLMSLIRGVCAMNDGVFPATLNYETPDSAMEIEEWGFRVPRSIEEWTRPRNGGRRLEVNSFGFGGHNYVALLEDAGADGSGRNSLIHGESREIGGDGKVRGEGRWDERERGGDGGAGTVMSMDASTSHDTGAAVGAVTDAVTSAGTGVSTSVGAALATGMGTGTSAGGEAKDPSCDAVLFVVGEGSGALRVAVTGASEAEARGRLAACDLARGAAHLSPARIRSLARQAVFVESPQTKSGTLGMIFAGQGTAYPGMGASLYEHVPSFRRRMDHFASLLDDLPVLDLLFHGDDEAMKDTRLQQPGLFILEHALAGELLELGIKPTCLAGHSTGELTALSFAGVYSPEDGLRIVYKRAQCMAAAASLVEDPGIMLAVDTDAETLEPVLRDYPGVCITNVNSPTQTVIGGATSEALAVAEKLRSMGRRATQLKVSMVFHSPGMRVIRDELQAFVDAIPFHSPKVPIISNTTGKPFPDDPVEIRKIMLDNLEHPVQWVGNIQRMRRDFGVGTFLEVGPSDVLCSMVQAILPDALCIPSCLKECPEQAMAAAKAELYRLRFFDPPSVPRSRPQPAHRGSPAASFDRGAALDVVKREVARFALEGVERYLKPAVLEALRREISPSIDLQDTASLMQSLLGPGPAPPPASPVMAPKASIPSPFRALHGTTDSPAEISTAPDDGTGSSPSSAAAPEVDPGHLEASRVIDTDPMVVRGDPVIDTEDLVIETGLPMAETEDPVVETVIRIIMEVTGYEREEIAPEMDIRKDLTIRSSRLPVIMDASEKRFGISIQVMDFMTVRTVRDIAEVIKELVRRQGAEPGAVPAEVPRRRIAEEVELPSRSSKKSTPVLRHVFVETPLAETDSEPLSLARGKTVVAACSNPSGALFTALDQLLGSAGARVRRVDKSAPAAVLSAVQDAGDDLAGLVVLAEGSEGEPEGTVAGLTGWLEVMKAFMSAPAGTFVLYAEDRRGIMFEAMLGMFLCASLEKQEARFRCMEIRPGSNLDKAFAAAFGRPDGIVELIATPDGFLTGTVQPAPGRLDFGRHPRTLPGNAGGAVILSGGGRGITAWAARALAAQGYPLVLCGTTPLDRSIDYAGIFRKAVSVDEALSIYLAAHRPGHGRHPGLGNDFGLDREPGRDPGRDPGHNPGHDPGRAPGHKSAHDTGHNPGLKAGIKASQYPGDGPDFETSTRLRAGMEIYSTLADARACGVEAMYRVCDVSDPSRVASLVDEAIARFGAVEGVIHGAGVLRDSFISLASPEDFGLVCRVKCDGASHLFEAARNRGLRFFAAFSSLSAYQGNIGQAAYCAANRMMAALMRDFSRRAPAVRFKTLWLPPIEGAGMADDPEVREILSMRSLDAAYMDLAEMSRFLEMEVLLNEAEDDWVMPARFIPPVPTVAGARPAADSGADRRVLLGHGLGQGNFPLIAEVDSFDPQSGGITTSRSLSASSDPWLDDHRPFTFIEASPASIKAALASAIVGTENMLEAAALLSPGLRPVRVTALSFFEAIPVPAGATVRTRCLGEALPSSGPSSSSSSSSSIVTAVIEAQGPEGGWTPRFSGMVHLSRERSDIPVLPCFPVRREEIVTRPWTEHEVRDWYEARTRLTGRYRVLGTIEGTSPDAIRAEMLYRKTSDFGLNGGACYLYSPYILEALMHLVVFFATVRDEHEKRSLMPAHIEAAHLGRQARDGEAIALEGRLVSWTDLGLLFNCRASDAQGKVLMQAQGINLRWIENTRE